MQTSAPQRAPSPEAHCAAPAGPAPAAAAPALGLTPAAALALQRTVGNAAVTRMLARKPADAFNSQAIADELERAIDQSDVADGWTADADGLHATTRKVDAAKVIAALDGLTPEQVERVKSLYKTDEGTTLENDLFEGGQSAHPSNLKPDARARIRALLRGTGAAVGKATPDARLEADAAELHDLLGGDLSEAQRERVMTLWRRPVAEIAAMDTISLRLFSMHPAAVLPVRLRGLQLQRGLALRAGDAAKADALALEDKRRELEELKARKESGDMGMLELASYERKRRKLVDGIGAIVDTNRREALADRANENRTADEAVQAKLAKVLAARTEPAKTVGAALAETLQDNEATAIAAPLVESAARKVLELEQRHTTSSAQLAEIIHELRAAAQHDTQLELPKLTANTRLLDPATAEEEFGKLVNARAGGYITALIQTYDRLKPADGRTWAAIVASADAGNREMLTALTETGGKLAPVDELHYAIGKRDAATIKQILRDCGTQDGLRRLEKEYRDKFGTDLRQAIFRTESAGQAMDPDALPWAKTAAVRGRDAANVDELLNAPTQLGGAEEAAATAAGGMREAVVTRENAGTLGWLRELGDMPETQQIMNRSTWQLQLLHMQWIAAADNPQRQAEILAEMRQMRSTLSGDAAAYEQDNERLADQIRSAVSLAVQIGLAVALPGIGEGLTGFIATSAANVGASVAANAVIYGDKYDLDAMLKDLEGSVLGALGGKLGEDVAKLIVAEVAERAGIAAVRAAQAAGKTPKLAAELGRLAENAAQARVSMRGLVEGGAFAGSTGLTTVVTGENGLTYEAALTAFLTGRLQAAKAARAQRAQAAEAPASRPGGEQPADTAGPPRPKGTPADGVPAPVEDPPTKPMKDPRKPFPEGTPPRGVPQAAGSSAPANVPPLPDAVPVPIHEQPTIPMPTGTPPGMPPDGDAVPEPIHDDPTVPIPQAPPGDDAIPVPVHDQPTIPMPTETPTGTPPGMPPDDDAVPEPIHDDPTVPIPQAPPGDDAIPVPVHEQPTTPIPEAPSPEGDDAVPVPVHEQPTIPMPKGTPPEGVPAGDDAVPLPIQEQPTIPAPKGTPPHGVQTRGDGVAGRVDDQPAGFWHVPADGGPAWPAGPEGELPVRGASADDPEKTGRWRRPEAGTPSRPEDGGPGRVRPPGGAHPEVVTTLPDGSLVYGDPEQPFTLADAERVYDRLIGDTAHREAQIIQDIDSGECIVVQGSTIDTVIDPAARAGFLEDRPWITRWRTVRHYHGVGHGGVTPHSQRYPSVYDMRGAQKDAQRNFRPQDELLDFAAEHGRGSIPFGYDQTQTQQPFWVGVPDAAGVYRPRRFANVYEYQVWYEQQLTGPG